MCQGQGDLNVLTIWFRLCCVSGALLLLLPVAFDVEPVAGPMPLTTAAEVGVGRVPFCPVVALLGPAGLGGGILLDIVAISTSSLMNQGQYDRNSESDLRKMYVAIECLV